MSLRTELQEVVKWIADLSEEKPKPTPEPPTREDWGRVENNLEDATETLREAHSELLKERRPPFLAELATDLQRQAEELSVRAKMLKRRAAPETAEQKKAKEDAQKKAKTEADAKAAAREQARAEARAKAEAAGKAQDPAKAAATDETAQAAATAGASGVASRPKHLPESIARLNTALHTVDTAHLNLEVDGQPDPVATAFLGELEVLFEMTLSLRQRAEQSAPVEQAKKRTEKRKWKGLMTSARGKRVEDR